MMGQVMAWPKAIGMLFKVAHYPPGSSRVRRLELGEERSEWLALQDESLWINTKWERRVIRANRQCAGVPMSRAMHLEFRNSRSKSVKLRRILNQNGLAHSGVRGPDGKLVHQPAIVDLLQRGDVSELAAGHPRRVRVRPVATPQNALRIRGDPKSDARWTPPENLAWGAQPHASSIFPIVCIPALDSIYRKRRDRHHCFLM
jgi:hypothetical protein